MNPNLSTLCLVATLTLLTSGCSENPGESPSTTSATTATQQTTTPPETTEVTTPATSDPTSASPASWVMPNLVGQNLQAAQDAIQQLTDHGVFFTSSTDATGQGRAQVLDSNWKVCAQNIRPGDTITAATKIEFAAVKLDERCP